MKKLDSRGFIMAETLVVALFLMTIFTMIYVNFYPMIGEYEKRENYDDVDGKYVAYWIKKMVESDSYSIVGNSKAYATMNRYGFIRFECKDMEDDQRQTCIDLVKALEISNCDSEGNGCDAFITRYQIGNIVPDFKNMMRTGSITVGGTQRSSPTRFEAATAGVSGQGVKLFYNCCKMRGFNNCINSGSDDTIIGYLSNNSVNFLYQNSSPKDDAVVIACIKYVKGKVFSSLLQDYVLSLPNYQNLHNDTKAKYRVIVSVHHEKDYNNYYSFSTMEVIK